jgi:hypothetical protein
VLVVPLVLIVPMDPAVPLVSVDVMPVAEVSVDDIVLVIEVEDVSDVDIVLVIPVSVAFSSFLQPNAKITIARSEKTVTERDFFISFSLFHFAGKPGRNVSAARSRGAIV